MLRTLHWFSLKHIKPFHLYVFLHELTLSPRNGVALSLPSELLILQNPVQSNILCVVFCETLSLLLFTLILCSSCFHARELPSVLCTFLLTFYRQPEAQSWQFHFYDIFYVLFLVLFYFINSDLHNLTLEIAPSWFPKTPVLSSLQMVIYITARLVISLSYSKRIFWHQISLRFYIFCR